METGDDTTQKAVDGKTLYLFDVLRGTIAETLRLPVARACLQIHLAKM